MQINAKEFDKLARTFFAPIYPVIARQIVDHNSSTRGHCLDVGCGAALALREIFRVRASGGRTRIGGGFGTRVLKEAFRRQMAERNKGSDAFSAKMRCNLGPQMQARFEEALRKAGISEYEIIQNEDIGLWIAMCT